MELLVGCVGFRWEGAFGARGLGGGQGAKSGNFPQNRFVACIFPKVCYPLCNDPT